VNRWTRSACSDGDLVLPLVRRVRAQDRNALRKHSPQMNTAGPAISFATSLSGFLQNEH